MAKKPTKKERKITMPTTTNGRSGISAAPNIPSPLRIAVNDVFETNAATREAITANLKELRVRSVAVTDRVQAAFDKFDPNALTKGEATRRHYIAPLDETVSAGKRLQSYQQRLGELQNSIIKNGVESMGSPETNRTLVLRKTDALKALINDAPKNGSITGTIALDELTSFISKMPTTEPIEIYSKCKAETEANQILDAAEGVSQSKTEEQKKEDTKDTDRTAEELVKGTVNTQMETATSPEGPLLFNIQKRADQAQIQGSINTFELRAGASDVTSYHDFSSLQIAFAHVWTRIFDGQLESLGRELYGEYVKLKNFVGNGDPDPAISTLDDLARLMDEIKKLTQNVQDDVPPSLLPSQDRPSGDPVGQILTPENGIRTGVAVATGGASLFIEWAFNELIAIGNKPLVVSWSDFPLTLDTGNTIELLAPERDVVYPGMVEVVLETDSNSYKKKIDFQQWDPNRQVSNFNTSVQNFPPPRPSASVLLNTTQVGYGTLKFVSEDKIINELLLGRYVLGDLTKMLTDRTRLTFRWKGSR